jgi:hypothetical protein
MNEHKKISELLTEFILGELSKEQASEVRTHIENCSECSDEIKHLEALLEHTEHIRESSVDEQTCESAKQAILRTVEQEKTKQQTSGTYIHPELIWRTIMNSRTIKFAAAAVIIITAAIILYNSSIDLAGTTYAQMRENIRKMPWVHIITQGVYEGKEVEMEQWFSDEESIIALKKPGGELGFSDYKNGRRYIYDPNTRVISLSFIEPSEYPKNAIPLQNGIDSMLSMLIRQQADIVHRSGRFQGEKVEIYDVEYKVGKITINGRINVDPRSRLPISCEYVSIDDEGNQATAWMRFEFPEKGPRNIYDIGAPDSAKAPARDLQDVLETYLSHRNNCPQRYIAIVTEEQWYDKIQYLDIIFNDGKTQSKEKLSTDEFKEQWMKYAGQKDVSFDDMIELAQKGGNEYNSISLYVDGKSYWAYRSQNQPWKVLEQPSSGTNRLARDDLAGLGWPIFSNMQNQGTIVKNDYSRENNLICIQQLHQGEKMPEGHPDKVHLPSKYLYYLNPARDYICERIEYCSMKDAPWQKDKSWLEGVELNELSMVTRNITEVTEYRHTEKEKWYPYKIEFRISSYDPDTGSFRPYSLNSVKTVYLNTEPEFPEGIFDPNNLPKN